MKGSVYLSIEGSTYLSAIDLADKNFVLLKSNPRHPSLRFKKVGAYRSVHVGLGYRALAVEVNEGLLWLWIGTHADYDDLLR